MSQLINIIGNTYNKLTVIEYIGQSKWKCLCNCGNYTEVRGFDLKRNHTKSCGCLAEKNALKHGKRNSKEYNSWRAMKDRCYNTSNLKYKDYGGRGIEICNRWLESFENFLEDMGEKPKGYSIDRIDNNGNYTPENCRWRSSKEQSYNKRNTLIIEHNNELRNLSEWSQILNIPYNTLKSRFYRKGTII